MKGLVGKDETVVDMGLPAASLFLPRAIARTVMSDNKFIVVEVMMHITLIPQVHIRLASPPVPRGSNG